MTWLFIALVCAKTQQPWLEFFGNKPFTQQPQRAITQANQLLDYKSWSEEDRKMFSQLHMREEQVLLAQDYAKVLNKD